MPSRAVRVQSSVMAALLLTASGCGSTGGNPSGSGGPWLLYAGAGVFALDGSKPSAAVVTVDANAEWVGFPGDATALLATGLSAAGSYSGASLLTVAAATGAAGIQLGTVPAGIESVSRLRWPASKGLLRGFTRDANGGMFGEVLFANASAAGSLLRVTNTPAISETVP